MKDAMLSQSELNMLRGLSRRGWAIAIFNPAELGEVNPGPTEDAMIEAGWAHINWAKGLK
jgi:hypothetical protein